MGLQKKDVGSIPIRYLSMTISRLAVIIKHKYKDSEINFQLL